MHPSPPMPEEIKAGFYPGFEHGWHRAELIGRAVMLMVIGATLVGLLGGGPASLWTTRVAAGPLQAEYPPVVRFGTPTGFTLQVAPTPGQDTVSITLPPAVVKQYGLQSVFPQPFTWSTDAGGAIRIVVPVQPGTREAVIHVGGLPSGSGWMYLSAKLGDEGPVINWTQIVLP